jgi:DNA-binding GntR family transcriptional regulator
MSVIETGPHEGLNTAIYAELRSRLVSGRMAPGQELSTRTLAAEMGVSQTPVRDALSRLAADGAVAIRSKRRVLVPRMTPERFSDLVRCRVLLEPEAACLALPHLDASHIARLREIDAALDRALAQRDAEAYLRQNHAFHFSLYRAQPGKTLAQVIETLWLQAGPFMRVVFDKLVMATNLNDHHEAAISAIAAGDVIALRTAIEADIRDGMSLIANNGFATGAAAAP